MNRLTTSVFTASVLVSALLYAAPAAAELRVVTTLSDLAAIAAAVGGDQVRVEAIAAPSEDPHFVDPRPSHLVKLSRADVLIVNGLGLEEGWLPPLQTQARNRAIQSGGAGYVDASTLVSNLIDAERVVDRSMGDVHPGGNPHFTFDPRAAREIANGLAAVFTRLDAPNAAAFEAGRASFIAQLDAEISRRAAQFGALGPERRSAVVYHDSLPYLLDWLQITQVATVEPTPGVPPDPRRVAEVVQTIRGAAVPLLAQEQFYPSNTSSRIAELGGATLVIIDGGTDFAGGETYLEHISGIADALFEAIAP